LIFSTNSNAGHSTADGIHALNVFVKKPFIDEAPDLEEAESFSRQDSAS